MANESDSKVKPEDLKELYKLSLESLRYHHNDIWRAQQFYTTLNIGIITAALALVRFFESSPDNIPATFWIGPVILFGVGALTSELGYYTVKRLREYFLQAVTRKTLFEYLLGYRKELSSSIVTGFPKGAKSSLAVPPIYGNEPTSKESDTTIYNESLTETAPILEEPDKWVKDHIIVKTSIVQKFLTIQRIFGFINIALGVLVAFRVI